MRLLVLDGNSIINRAYYGIKLLSTKDGQYTNGLFGFLNILQKLRDETSPDGIAAAFDLRAPTFRHVEYPEYKAGRKAMPEELAEQMPLIKQILSLMGIRVVECEGYEADDILGTLAAAATEQGHSCVIATGDRDSLQLVDENVTVYLAATKMGQPQTTIYTPAAVQEKYGMTPPQLIDLKALMGDSGDNIPGVPGVGEKTALELMHKFGALDAIYDDIDTLDIRDSLRTKLINGRDSAYISRRLGLICREVPIDRDVESYRLSPVQREELTTLLARLELFKIIEKLNLSAPAVPPNSEQLTFAMLSDSPAAQSSAMEPPESAPALIAGIKAGGVLDVTAEYTDGEIALFCVVSDGKAVKINRNDEAFDSLVEMICDVSIQKRTTDSKRLHAAMLKMGRVPQNIVMDTALAGYLLNPLSSDYSLRRLAQEYAVPLVSPDIFILSGVADKLAAELEQQGQLELLHDVEIPLAAVLADMEHEGFAVDAEGIAAFGAVLGQKIETLRTAVCDAVGYEFNLNSPKQLAEALFEKLGLPSGKKTKTGYSTNADVLEKLRDIHPAVSMLLDYRTLSKLKSTYCDGLGKVIAADGRIHSSFNQTETRTGRISSTEPNLQNIPVRQELGRELRRFFKAREGYMLCDADYSQIELRVLAHMANDKVMIDAFNSGTDIHNVTASQVFGVPTELVTPTMRSQAKAVNFGIVYGIGAHSLSEDIGVSHGEAKQYIGQYLTHYSGVSAFMDLMVEQAKEAGYSRTMYGRRRPLPELKSSNGNIRSFGERVARNMPIQGTAADIIKIAMIRVWKRLRDEGLKARLILQVHDELIVEAPADESVQASLILHEEMEAAAEMSVRLEAEVHTGTTWYDAKI